MLYRDIARIVGYYLLVLAICMLIPLGLSISLQFSAQAIDPPQPSVTLDFLFAIGITLFLGSILIALGRKSSGSIYRKEGLAAVVFIWLLTPALSGLPFLTSGTLDNFYQAYFEMTSGYTTTGSTILMPKKYDPQTGKEIRISKTIAGTRNTTYQFFGTVKPIRDLETGITIKEGIEAVEKTLLFWRSFTQWLGGVGIVVLFVAILPLLGVGGKLLFQAEVTGPNKGIVTPRIKETAIELWKIYLVLTALEVFILMMADWKLPLFDAITVAFSTISTGGFSVKNASIAAYQSFSMEWVITLFMILGSINFSLYYFVFRGKFYRLYETEFLLFLLLVISLSLTTAWLISGTQQITLEGIMKGDFHLRSSLRYGIFQLVSAITSTGFVTTKYDIWPYGAQAILWLSMFFGGMSGSTAGGIKTIRLYMLFKTGQHKVESLFQPEKVQIFRIGKWEVESGAAINVLCFFLIVASSGALGTLLYIFDGIDMQTSIGLVACMLNNTGLSFGMAAPEASCAFLSNFSLMLSSIMMILGRLEYYALLAFVIPSFWRKGS